MASGCPSNGPLCFTAGKRSWPELCRVQGKTAAATIEKENPSVMAQILVEGTPVMLDIRCDRVRVWVNKDGIVTRVPVVG